MGACRVLITGAGSGVGLALAHRMPAAAMRWRAWRSMERVPKARASLPGEGHAAFTVDVGSDASMQVLRDAVLSQWGVPEVLVNAGIASGGNLLDSTMDEWRGVLARVAPRGRRT